jgi:chromosome partitioning protein
MPQGTSASWYALREQAGKASNLVGDTAADHRELIAKVEAHSKNADFIVLDGPPRIAEMTRAIMVLADLCLVPVGASVAEIWATSDVLELVEQAKKVRPVDARMVWTRHRPHTKLAKELTALATQELGLPILKTALALRVAYPEALGSGLTVAEMPDANAKTELRELVAEIRKIVR